MDDVQLDDVWRLGWNLGPVLN
jgi:hypothetical protein